MPEATNTETPVPDDSDTMTTAEYIAAFEGGGFKDGSAVDVKAFDAGVQTICETMPSLKAAEDASTNAKVLIAQAIQACRYAVTFKGEPDTFGQSGAYQTLFEKRITMQVKRANPGLDGVWIKKQLDQVRINYLSWTATRAKGMTLDGIVQDAARRGEIKDARVMPDGRVIIEPKVKDKASGEMVRKTKREKDEAGNPVDVPVTLVYSPGQRVDVPAEVKKAVQTAINTRSKRKKDAETGQLVQVTTVPEWMGGPAKDDPGTGGNKPKGPADYAALYRDSLAVITDSVTHLTAEAAIQWFHAAATVLVDNLNAAKLTNPDDRASDLQNVAALLGAEAKVLAGKAEVDTIAKWRHVPEDAPKDDAPKDETLAEDTPTPEDEAAADEAAAQDTK